MKTITTLLFLISIATTANGSEQYYSKQELKALAKQGQNTLSYDEARVHILGNLYLEKMNNQYFVYDVYCQEMVFHKSIGPREIPSNNILNVEHIWPQSKFNPRESRRKQKTDLHHLLPADAKANGIRGNNEFGYVNQNFITYPGCEGSHYDKYTRLFEPADSIKGNIARSMFYFSVRYGLEIGEREEAVLREWNRLDPVTEIDIETHEKKFRLQGNRNPFIDNPHLVDKVQDF